MKPTLIILFIIASAGFVALVVRDYNLSGRQAATGASVEAGGQRSALPSGLTPAHQPRNLARLTKPRAIAEPVAPPAQSLSEFNRLNLGGKIAEFPEFRPSESNRITQALVAEGLSPEYAAEVYAHITALAAQHRTNRGVFPGATTNGVAFTKWPLFEEEQ